MNWAKIDKFYIILFVILAAMAAVVIFAGRSIFTSFITAYEVEPDTLSTKLRIDTDKLDEATSWVNNKESIKLEVR
jgi:hypothetical protein